MLARINQSYVPTFWDDFFNDRFFNDLDKTGCSTYKPAMNVSEDEKAYRIEVAAPGVSRKEFKMEIHDNTLTISTEPKEGKEEKKQNYLRREFGQLAFTRNFKLPESVDQKAIEASFDAGILQVNLPKKQEVVEDAHRQIEIK